MEEPIVVEHALKHGLSEEDIRYAWSNFVRKQYRGAPNEGEIVVVGYDRRGRFIEIVAAEREFGPIYFEQVRIRFNIPQI